MRSVEPGGAEREGALSEPVAVSLPALVLRARPLAHPGRRRILGVTGPPGAGKSTVAAALVAALGDAAVLVPMDGFHLANRELDRLGRRSRKGAQDTFDAAGYVALLRRLRDPDEACVYAPSFRRDLEEPIAGAIPVPADVPLVITEGNYLLVDSADWAAVPALLDEVWFLAPPSDVRLARLVRRHQEFGKSAAEAHAWAHGSDERNAELVEATRSRADLVLRLTD
jgi:pantothenate kinase